MGLGLVFCFRSIMRCICLFLLSSSKGSFLCGSVLCQLVGLSLSFLGF